VTTALATPLTAADRCDRCGAQAYVRATLSTGELLFCAHHARAHEKALRPQAVEWSDQTARLVELVASPADTR
jgi:hypothetical protein